jgi:hypothetical protein
MGMTEILDIGLIRQALMLRYHTGTQPYIEATDALDRVAENLKLYEELLREAVERGPKLDERVLANYPKSWEYRARQALGLI